MGGFITSTVSQGAIFVQLSSGGCPSARFPASATTPIMGASSGREMPTFVTSSERGSPSTRCRGVRAKVLSEREGVKSKNRLEWLPAGSSFLHGAGGGATAPQLRRQRNRRPRGAGERG